MRDSAHSTNISTSTFSHSLEIFVYFTVLVVSKEEKRVTEDNSIPFGEISFILLTLSDKAFAIISSTMHI
jgi:hypothetical protein